ncbi:efflux RND transporter periplasmic adaptor subunit [Ammoniphilus resinae]|uniref:Multidrug resistance efflux pump n=1 Tax=Ammoniphilus resinae TaxID=861532 RepID=A0ABS4GQH4_9BACL|nr:efflux RND transporter periplasmic adaptor subunit [Ammoniphilus resinae]MBP1932491.1 multidrug resistance efflux pump [Ammoniphilus resinae]
MRNSYIQKALACATVSSMIFVLGACNSVSTANGEDTVATAVKVIKLAEASNSGLTSSGKVIADQEVNVVSKVSGKVANVTVKEGTQVQKGQELIKLESDDYVLQVKQAESGIQASQAKLADVKDGARAQEIAALESVLQASEAAVVQAQTALDTTEKTNERMKALFEAGAISQAEWDNANLQLENAKAAYQQAKSQWEANQAKLSLTKEGATANTIRAMQAELTRLQASKDLAENALQNTSIVSPISGVVAVRNIEPGEMAQPGVSLMTIVDLQHVLIQVSVSQEHVNQLKKGDKVQVLVKGIEKDLEGTIDFISPLSDENSTNFPVKIRVENKDGVLRAGMLADVVFSGHTKSGIEIPTASVVKKENKNYVFKIEDNMAKLIEVQVEPKNQDWVYVKSGIESSDQIVINPTDSLADGAQVRVE